MSSPLRLMHVAGGVGPNVDNGLGRAVYHVAYAQRALGHDVGIVSEGAEHLDEDDPPAAAHGSPLFARARSVLSLRQAAPTLVRELIDYRPDVVHLHST